MALVSLISYSIKAAVGKPKSLPIYVPTSGLTIANAQLFSDDMAAALDAVTEGVIETASVTFTLTLPSGLKTTAVTNSDIQEGALFSMTPANTAYNQGIWVPAFLQSLFAGEDVPYASGAAATFKDLLINGSHTVLPSDRYANDLVGITSAVKTFRRK